MRLALALALLLGCDRRAATEALSAEGGRSEQSVDAGSESGDGHDADLTDSAASEALDAEVAPSAAPPPGACGVVRRVPITAGRRVVRVLNGFAVGPERDLGSADSALEWLAVAEDGQRRTQFAVSRSRQISLAALPVGDPFAGSLLTVMPTQSGSDERVSAELITGGAPGEFHDLGAAFYRGTIKHSAAVSLDGARIVYATGHVGVDNPHAFVIDQHASRVGDPLLLSESEDPLFDCLDVAPTEQAGIVSFIDREFRPATLRLIEIGANAVVFRDLSVEVGDSSACPTVTLAERGLWVSVPGVTPNTFDLLAIDGGEATVRESGLSRGPRWVGESPSGELLYLIGGRLSRKDPNNEWVDVPGQLEELGAVIASEPGRLFVTSSPAEDRRELLEVACGDLAPLTLSN